MPPAATPTPTPAPLAAPVAPAPLRATSPRLWLGAAIAAAVVALIVFGIARLVSERPDPRPRAPAVTTRASAIDAMPQVIPQVTTPQVMTPDAAPSPDAMIASPQVIDAAPAIVRLTITSTPEGARATIRRGTTVDTCETPCALTLPPGTEPATLTLSAPGYTTLTRTLVPHVDAEVVMVLQRTPVDKPRRRTRPASDDLIRPE
jgi:hypothetical protein